MSKMYKINLPFSPGDEVYNVVYAEETSKRCEGCRGSGSKERFDCHGSYDVGCSACKGAGYFKIDVDPEWVVSDVSSTIKRIICYPGKVCVDFIGVGFMSADLTSIDDCFLNTKDAKKECIKRNKALAEALKLVSSKGRI